MSDNPKVIRLINLLNDRFVIPHKTDGMNVIMDLAAIEVAVNSLWAKDENWTTDQLVDALQISGVPSFVNSSNVRKYLLVFE